MLPHRRPRPRARERAARRPAGPDGGPHVVDALRRHEGDVGERLHQHQEPSHTITAEVEIPAAGANGVVLAQGGRFGGWSLYFKDGKPSYTYNFLGMQQFTVSAPQALPAGKATLRFDFAYDGGGLGKGGAARSRSTARRWRKARSR